MRGPLIDQFPQVDQLGMVGVKGNKFTAIRVHLEQNIAQVYKDLDISYVPTRPAALWSLEPLFQL